MPRALTPEQLAEYVRMRDFALALSEVLDEMARATPTSRAGMVGPDGVHVEYEVPNDDLQFRASLAQGLDDLERRSMTQARAGIRMAVQDLLEATRHVDPGFVQRVDARFAAAGLPTLSWMRREVWKTIPKVLARGRIRTEEEYYLLIERLNDVSDTDGLSAEERDLISRMVDDFEARNASPKKRGR